jgi:hypothetical protein
MLGNVCDSTANPWGTRIYIHIVVIIEMMISCLRKTHQTTFLRSIWIKSMLPAKLFPLITIVTVSAQTFPIELNVISERQWQAMHWFEIGHVLVTDHEHCLLGLLTLNSKYMWQSSSHTSSNCDELEGTCFTKVMNFQTASQWRKPDWSHTGVFLFSKSSPKSLPQFPSSSSAGARQAWWRNPVAASGGSQTWTLHAIRDDRCTRGRSTLRHIHGDASSRLA